MHYFPTYLKTQCTMSKWLPPLFKTPNFGVSDLSAHWSYEAKTFCVGSDLTCREGRAGIFNQWAGLAFFQDKRAGLGWFGLELSKKGAG